MKASDLFVRALEQEGVEYIFAIPGEENLDMLESLRGSAIKLVVTRHEQGAGFMAATYGRLTGKSGVCMSTLGPGATNLVTAAAYAQLGGMPMVMITGQKPIKSSKQGQFQIIDIVDMMRPLTKFTKTIVGGDYVPAHVREAFRQSEEERPGATHLEFPEDIAREHSTMPVLEPSYTRRPIAEDKALRKAAEAIVASRKPLLLVGAGANRKLTSTMLRKFVDKLGVPVVTTQMGKGVIDESGPHFIGNTALSDGDFVHRAIEQADLIINVGHDVVEKPPFFMRPGGPEVVHINFSSAQVDPVYFPQIEVVGDIANSLWRLDQLLEPQDHWSFTDAHRIRSALQKHIQEGSSTTTFPIRPQRLVKDIRDVMPEKGVIALDNGMFKIWFARNYPALAPNTVLLDNALATMGAGLPSAMAAKLVCPDRRVMAICGDGGFMMNSQEVETAVRLNLDLIVLILRDNAYGMIKWKQAMMEFEDFGLDLGNPDFVEYAESYGAHGHRVEKTDELKPIIEKCCKAGGVHLIDVPVDYSHNDRILNHEIRELSSKL
ncbi:acetolactate synthase large subunit [Microbulbifer sp. OS29]|uniref:Acetolactate synthase large subunit n=1 Tax=Microbulbifer okhotskensis TaxID=2926617 RepID=A0A9X2ERS4_9GAMM|nr:acetolactate synthase large subunit [Microbulbifer okhotskensis]MCO1336624.1 acetolactate synthase large subunit [Microbulbifer okhotskensis]